jgi:hypothetical protein
LNASPPSPPISDDPLRGPLRLLVIGLAVSAAWSVIAATGFAKAVYGGSASMSLVTALFTIANLVDLAGTVLVLAGLAQIAKQNRPERSLVTAALVVNAMTAVTTVGWLIISLASTDLGRVPFRLFSFVSNGLYIAALFLLALSLRALATSRARSFDGVFVFVCIALALGLVQALVDVTDLTTLPVPLTLFMMLLNGGARLALCLGTRSIAAGAPLGDPVLDQGSAYRGPTGALAGTAAQEGSMGLGFAAGFFGGCLGLILVLVLAKGQATKRGAGIGFACQAFVGIIVNVIVLQSSGSRHF